MLAPPRATADALAHRGPNGSGSWADPGAGVALGQQRLAIVDRSPTDHQHMHSRFARFVPRDNGELYNHRELLGEQQAAGKAFRGTSDSEVISKRFSVWGVQATMKHLTGMFAIAVFDSADVSLHVIRDRFGIGKDFDEATQPTPVADHLGTDRNAV